MSKLPVKKLTSHKKFSCRKHSQKAREPCFISQPRFHAELVCPQKHLNAKLIPQFDFTNHLALIGRFSSNKIYYQTFSNLWVVQNLNFPVMASGL